MCEISIGGSQTGPATCDTHTSTPLVLSETEAQTVHYTYRVTWSVSQLSCPAVMWLTYYPFVGIRYNMGLVVYLCPLMPY